MDTVDKADQVTTTEPKKQGRPKKQDPTTPQGELRQRDAEAFKARKENTVVEKWYEVRGHKLTLCKRVKSGTVYRTYVGSLEDKIHGKEIRAFVEQKKAEGQVKVRI
jgi:hypothetical protein